MSSSGLVIFPPGWDVTVPGPYLAGPLLKGFATSRNVHIKTVDLNIEVVNRFAHPITAYEAERAVAGGRESMDTLYFGRQAELELAADRYDGSWTLRDAYQPNSFDPGVSASVKEHLYKISPYEKILKERLKELLDETGAKTVGVTIVVPSQIYGAFVIARLIRDIDPSVTTVAGGNIVTRLLEEMSLPWVFEFFDVLVTNQGEEPLVELVQNTDDRARWKEIPNLCYLDRGKVHKTTPRPLARKLFTQPDYSDVDFAAYWGFHYAPAIAVRGCYYGKCSFCAIPFAWGNKGYLGADRVETVVQSMIETYERYGINRFRFMEESLHPGTMRKISKQLIARGINLEWEGYARLDKAWFDPEFLKLTARAGLRKVYAGLEMIEEDSRNLLNKHDIPDAKEFLLRMKDAGILVHVFLLVGHPGTSSAEAMRSFDFVYENRDLIDTLDISGFRYEKHTEISGVNRRPDPIRDWVLNDPYQTDLKPSLGHAAMVEMERTLFSVASDLVPRWTHSIYHMSSPWMQADAHKKKHAGGFAA